MQAEAVARVHAIIGRRPHRDSCMHSHVYWDVWSDRGGICCGMKSLPHCVGLYLLFYGVLSNGAMADLTESGVTPEQLQELVVNWSDAFKSFRGRYTLKQTNYTDSDAPYTEEVIEYRFQDDNRWIRMTGWPDSESVFTEAIYEGRSTRRVDRPSANQHGIHGEVTINQIDGWQWENVELMRPDVLFKRPYANVAIGDELASGTNYAIRRNGQWVLAHWVKNDIGSNVDIYFYPDGSIDKMEWLFRFGYRSPEAMMEAVPELVAEAGSPFELRVVQRAISYSNYVDLNGFRFPVYVRNLAYNVGGSEVGRQIKEAFAGGAISSQEYVARFYQCGRETQESTRFDFELDLVSAEVNVQLSASDFKIDYGAHALVHDADSGELFLVPTWSETILRGRVLVPCAVLLLAVICCAWLWYWRRPLA